MKPWKQEQLHLLLDQRPPDALFDHITAITHRMGFDHCAYGMRAPIPFAQPRILMFHNYPESWQRRYQDKGYLDIDPTVRHGLASLEAYVWPAQKIAEGDVEFWAEASAHGLRDGLSMPVLTNNGIRGMFTVTRSTTDSDPYWAEKLEWLSNIVHQGMSKAVIHQSYAEGRPRLTDRELEVLKWTADGMTSGEIADAINIAERTVNFHINSAVAKLGAPNRTAAVVRAVMMGLIT